MVKKHALLIGSQTGGLTGVHGDIEVMDDALTSLGFNVRKHIEKAATAAAIIDAFESLVQDTRSGDATVVYYSGHGGRCPNRGRDDDQTQPTYVQWIVPTDIDDRSGNEWNGILAEELSALQWQLTGQSPNVTTILDCCHSSRMFRDPNVVPKADDHSFPWASIDARRRT